MSAPLFCDKGSANYVPSVLRCTTRPNDLDSLAHVNNAVTLEYLEAGRWDWFKRNQLRHSGSVTSVVARAEVDYLQQIFSGELDIHTQMLSDPDEITYRAKFHQVITMRGHDDALLTVVEARIVVAFLDMTTRRLYSLQNFFEENRMPEAAKREQ